MILCIRSSSWTVLGGTLVPFQACAPVGCLPDLLFLLVPFLSRCSYALHNSVILEYLGPFPHLTMVGAVCKASSFDSFFMTLTMVSRLFGACLSLLVDHKLPKGRGWGALALCLYPSSWYIQPVAPRSLQWCSLNEHREEMS